MTSRRARGWWSVIVLAGCGADPSAPVLPDSGATPDAAAPHDEDGDGVADVADNCPHRANTDQADRGETDAGAVADGVGDACDPEPTRPGNRLALFDPMIALPDGDVAGASVDGDALRLEAPGWYVPSAVTPGRAVMEARVRLTRDEASAGGLVLARREAGGCLRQQDGWFRLSSGPGNGPAMRAPTIADQVPVVLTFRSAAGRWTCTSTSDGVTTTLADAVDSPDGADARPHVYPLRGVLWLDYLVVITLAP